MAKININLTNSWLFFIIVMGIFSILVVGGIAFDADQTGGDPVNLGHSGNEVLVVAPYGQDNINNVIADIYGILAGIEPLPECTIGQVLTKTATGWGCSTITSQPGGEGDGLSCTERSGSSCPAGEVCIYSIRDVGDRNDEELVIRSCDASGTWKWGRGDPYKVMCCTGGGGDSGSQIAYTKDCHLSGTGRFDVSCTAKCDSGDYLTGGGILSDPVGTRTEMTPQGDGFICTREIVGQSDCIAFCLKA